MTDALDYAFRKLRKVSDDAIASLDETNIAQIKFSNNKVSTTQRWIASHITIFASIKNRTVSTIVSPEKKPIDKSIGRIVKFASSLAKNEDYHGIARGPFTYGKSQIFDKKLSKMDMADAVEASINEATTNGALRCSGVFEKEVLKITLKSTGGIDTRDEMTRAYFSIRSFSSKDASGHSVSASRNLKGLDFRKAAIESSTIALLARNPSTLEEGTYDIFFEHLPSANILENASNSSSMFNVEAGLSFFIGSLGKKVGSESLTMVDDATADWGINSRRFDEEGVPCKKTEIIKKGVLKTYLHNTSTASKYKTKTTANAGILAPRAINPVVEKGNFNKEEMLGKIKKGLIVTNLWYTRFQNQASGDFSTIPRDGIFLVENGRIKKPVKGIRINDNMLRMLRNITSASNEQRQIVGWEIESPITVPQILVRKVPITKSTE
ncbi:TldD/PmbA family protein [Candidatus Woesearchaeota archaeon]|nr:TldD/PmbA family protein [Candidatus Woesearchaeota archaeon]